MSQTVLADRQEKELRAIYKKLMALEFIANGGGRESALKSMRLWAVRLSRVAAATKGGGEQWRRAGWTL